MKLDWNRKYTTIAVYSFLVLAAVILFWASVDNFAYIRGKVSAILAPLSPFVYGFVLAYLLSPVLNWSERVVLKDIQNRKLRRTLGIILTYLLVTIFLTLFFWIIIPQIVQSLTGLVSNMPSYVQSLYLWVNTLADRFPEIAYSEELGKRLLEFLDQLYSMLEALLPLVLSSVTKVTSGIIQFVVGIIISLYMLMSKERFFAQCKKLLTAILPDQAVTFVVNITREGNHRFSGFITGKILDSLIIGILAFICMHLMKMPYVLLCSFVIGVTNVIPYFGPFIGAIPCFLIILTVSPIKALWFAVFILILQQIDGNIIGPCILGDSTGLTAFWVIFAILLFGGNMGFVGMLIGVPLFALIYSLIRGLIEYCLWCKGKPLHTVDYASKEHPLMDVKPPKPPKGKKAPPSSDS